MSAKAAEIARLRRYSRHLLVPEIGLRGQEKLAAARVLCIGAGGLGNPVAAYLSAAGVGCIGILDDDTVDISNLQRQILFREADIGRSKVDVVAERISALNPHVRVEAFRVRLTAQNAREFVSAYDIVIDGSDSFSTRYLVNDAAVLEKRPNIFASIYRFEAQLTVFAADGRPCYRCLYPAPPPVNDTPSCAEGGVLGAVAGVAGSWQAAEALKCIMGIGDSMQGRLIRTDVLHARQREVTVRRDPDCPLCGDAPSIRDIDPAVYEREEARLDTVLEIEAHQLDAELAAGARLLDVREPHEAILGLVAGATHIPLSQFDARLHELDPRLTYIVACRVGAKSRIALARLHDAGLERVRHLKGGLLSYAAMHEELDAW